MSLNRAMRAIKTCVLNTTLQDSMCHNIGSVQGEVEGQEYIPQVHYCRTVNAVLHSHHRRTVTAVLCCHCRYPPCSHHCYPPHHHTVLTGIMVDIERRWQGQSPTSPPVLVARSCLSRVSCRQKGGAGSEAVFLYGCRGCSSWLL
jgi:hypothetical protein